MERTISINKYYTCMEHFEQRFQKYGRKNRFKAGTKEEYTLWKNEVRDILKDLIGLDKMETCDLLPQVIEKITLENNMIREKVIIQVEPEVWMPFFILIPEHIKDGEVQCFITPSGHAGGGKYSVAGCNDIPAIADKIELYNYDYGMQLAKLGYVVLCPDNRGFGERREVALQNDSEEAFLNGTCYQLAHMAEPLGQTVIGMFTWDLTRLIDYIQERKEWKSDKIGCLGFSGGGMQTLWLSALDDRVEVAVISGYMYGYQDSLLKLNGNCSCNYVPHLWEHVDMGDIGALIAPRLLMIQSGIEDKLNGERGIINAIEQVDIIRNVYQLFGKEKKLFHDICEGGHCWHGEALENFLMEHSIGSGVISPIQVVK